MDLFHHPPFQLIHSGLKSFDILDHLLAVLGVDEVCDIPDLPAVAVFRNKDEGDLELQAADRSCALHDPQLSVSVRFLLRIEPDAIYSDLFSVILAFGSVLIVRSFSAAILPAVRIIYHLSSNDRHAAFVQIEVRRTCRDIFNDPSLRFESPSAAISLE